MLEAKTAAVLESRLAKKLAIVAARAEHDGSSSDESDEFDDDTRPSTAATDFLSGSALRSDALSTGFSANSSVEGEAGKAAAPLVDTRPVTEAELEGVPTPPPEEADQTRGSPLEELEAGHLGPGCPTKRLFLDGEEVRRWAALWALRSQAHAQP